MFLAIELYRQGPVDTWASSTCHTSIYQSLILGKTYGILVFRTSWEEHFENLMGTNWEHIGDNNKNTKKKSSPTNIVAEKFQDEI